MELIAGGFEGFRVRSVDGKSIGEVEQILDEGVDRNFVVVAGRWMFSYRFVMPFDSIIEVNTHTRTVLVDRTKHEVREASPLNLGAGTNAYLYPYDEWNIR